MAHAKSILLSLSKEGRKVGNSDTKFNFFATPVEKGGLSDEIYPNPRGSFQAEGGWKGRKEGMDDGCLISVNFTGKAREMRCRE